MPCADYGLAYMSTLQLQRIVDKKKGRNVKEAEKELKRRKKAQKKRQKNVSAR